MKRDRIKNNRDLGEHHPEGIEGSTRPRKKVDIDWEELGYFYAVLCDPVMDDDSNGTTEEEKEG